MSNQDERATITSIEVKMIYPDGRVKTVIISDEDYKGPNDHYDINKISGIYFYGNEIEKGVSTIFDPNDDDAVREKWNTREDGADFKPAMMILQKDGGSMIKCGGHRNGLPPKPG